MAGTRRRSAFRRSRAAIGTAGQADPGLGHHADPGRRGEDDHLDRPGTGAPARSARKPILALRQPSMGPVFGRKGGATGGGACRLTPSDQINLAVHRRLPRHHRRPQPAGRGDRQPPPLRRHRARPRPGPLEAGARHERPGPPEDRDRPGRAESGGNPSRVGLRHHGGQRGHGHPLPGRLAHRPPRPGSTASWSAIRATAGPFWPAR